VFMLKAQAVGLRLISNAMASRVADFSIRDMREDRSSPLAEMREQIQALEQDYEDALNKQNTVMPVLGHGYSQSELEALL
jgi:ABC-type dipeptide/oligopeptide/nickel transport system ATPase subunit